MIVVMMVVVVMITMITMMMVVVVMVMMTMMMIMMMMMMLSGPLRKRLAPGPLSSDQPDSDDPCMSLRVVAPGCEEQEGLLHDAEQGRRRKVRQGGESKRRRDRLPAYDQHLEVRK
jgi:hypothetical protein